MISTIAGLMLMAFAQSPAQLAAPLPLPKRMPPARALVDLGTLIDEEDYPEDALRNEEEGTVGFRLEVGADGLVTGCRVTSSSGSASLDAATCPLLTERARFTPARDAKGLPATDTVSARIAWRIDWSAGLQAVRATLVVQGVKVTAAGEASCWRVIDRAPRTPVRCPGYVGKSRETLLAAGESIDQTSIVTLTPEGEEELTYSGDFGTLILDSEAVLTIAADGSRLECRIVRNEMPGAPEGSPSPPDPCVSSTPGRPEFEAAAAGTAPRVVRYRLKGFDRY